MDNKNIIIGGLVLTVLFLLRKNNKTDNSKLYTLRNNVTLRNDDGEDNYKATFVSQNPIQAKVIKTINDNRYSVIVQSNAYDDNFNPPLTIGKIPNTI